MERETNDLRENLIKFQRLTASLINTLKQEDYDGLGDILSKREGTINIIKSLNYNAEVFKNISSELKLSELENTLNKLMIEKRRIVREQMDNLRTAKKANNNYQRRVQPDSMFFNKKI